MSTTVPTAKVKTPVTADNALGYILINESDFVEGTHELYTEPEPEKEKLPSDGLTVDALKKALTDKGIAIPDGAKKPELAALLDAAPADAE